MIPAPIMPLGVVVVIGRDIARQAPHRIGAVPAQLQRTGHILRHRHDRQRAAQRFFLVDNRIQPELDQRADPFTNFQGREVFRRQGLRHRRIDAVHPGLDHRHCAAAKGIFSGVGVYPRSLGGIAHRRHAPAIERRCISQRRSQTEPERVKIIVAAQGAAQRLAHLGPKIGLAWPSLALGLALSLISLSSSADLASSVA